MSEIFEKIQKVKSSLEDAFNKCLFERLEVSEETKRFLIEEAKGVIRAEGLKLSDYIVVCDESNNSPEDIENGVVNVAVIPTIDRITVEFVLNNKEKENESE